MNYDSITIAPVEPDWAWFPLVLAISVIIIGLGILMMRRKKNFLDSMHDRPESEWDYVPSLMLIVVGAFILAGGLATPFMNAYTELGVRQQEAMVEQLGYQSADVAPSLYGYPSSYKAQTAEGYFVTGELEKYTENVYIMVPEAP